MEENIYILSDSAISRKLGEKFRFLRLRQNITQRQLAEDTQLSLSTIKKIEKGEIASFDSFIRVLRMLGKLDELGPLVKEEGLSPNEYFELTQIAKKKIRLRASKSKQTHPKGQKISKW